MKKMNLIFMLILSTCSLMAKSSYTLDNTQIDNLFEQAQEISLTSVVEEGINTLGSNAALHFQDEVNTKVFLAWIISWPTLGLVFFGVHRYILGTKPNMWAIYTFTCCGLFGIVPITDFFVLLIDGLLFQHGEKYIDNENFLMWA